MKKQRDSEEVRRLKKRVAQLERENQHFREETARLLKNNSAIRYYAHCKEIFVCYECAVLIPLEHLNQDKCSRCEKPLCQKCQQIHLCRKPCNIISCEHNAVYLNLCSEHHQMPSHERYYCNGTLNWGSKFGNWEAFSMYKSGDFPVAEMTWFKNFLRWLFFIKLKQSKDITNYLVDTIFTEWLRIEKFLLKNTKS